MNPVIIAKYKFWPIFVGQVLALVSDPDACPKTYLNGHMVAAVHHVCMVYPLDTDNITRGYVLTNTQNQIKDAYLGAYRPKTLPKLNLTRLDLLYSFLCYKSETRLLNGGLELGKATTRCDQTQEVYTDGVDMPFNDREIYQTNALLPNGEALITDKNELFGIYTHFGIVRLKP